MNYQYQRLADEIEQCVAAGKYAIGEKLPSLRKITRERKISLSTAYQAYTELEYRGIVEAKEKSGYFIRVPAKKLLPLPVASRITPKPLKVTVNTLSGILQENFDKPHMVPLGAAVPSPELLPVKALSRLLRDIGGSYLHAPGGTGYGSPQGQPELIRQLARYCAALQGWNAHEDIIITGGSLHAVELSLRAVAHPGDIIVVESPTFLCYLQLIEDLNMRVIEIPADPSHGIDLGVLAETLAEHDIRAALFNTNFPTPLGYHLPTDKKKNLVQLLHERNIPLIEDDIYGDLYYGEQRPSTCKQFDQQGLVLYCSSFSKSLLPDMRLGWVLPGRFTEKIKRLKFNSSLATSKLHQLVVARYLESGAYDRHLRKMRATLKKQIANMTSTIARSFPPDTRISAPQGGLCLWVELNREVDSVRLFAQAAAEGISILPGTACSCTSQYRHCIRLNGSVGWSRTVEESLVRLGQIIQENLDV